MTFRPTFFVKRGARLIARLQLLVYCWRFARRVDGQVIVIWPPSTELDQRFDGPEFNPSLIFDLQKFYAEGGASSLVFLEGRAAAPSNTRSVQDEEFASVAPHGFDRAAFVGQSHVFHEYAPITFTFRDEPHDMAYFRRSLRETYDLLPHHPAIANSLAGCFARTGKSYVALHVRRGDVIEHLRHYLPQLENGSLAKERFASILKGYVTRTTLFDSYYASVKAAIDEGRKILFLSDSPSTFTHFAEKFGERHFLDASQFARGRAPMQKAFVDFNLLVGASRIIGTSGSAFSAFAAMIGGGRLTNTLGVASLERMRTHLYESCLSGLDIAPESRRRIDAELEYQYGSMLLAHQPLTEEPTLPLK